MAGNVGTGPGEITADGCAVDFYALLPPMGEPEIVHAAVPDGASILELGCGTGRILRPLAGLGHPVTGVDVSAAMLAQVTDLPTVCSRIETLALDRAFGVVLLASNMINSAPATRRELLAACARNVAPGGVVVLQQTPPAWFGHLELSEDESDGIRRAIRRKDRAGPLLDVLIEYQVGDRIWTQAFDCYEVGEAELADDLRSAGLEFGGWLAKDRGWLTARPSA